MNAPPHVGCYRRIGKPAVLHAKRCGRNAWPHSVRLRDFRVVPPDRRQTEMEKFQSTLSAYNESQIPFRATAFLAPAPKLRGNVYGAIQKGSHRNWRKPRLHPKADILD